MKRILIVEDHSALAEVEQLICTIEGYDVRVFHSGEEGIADYDQFQPHLVILDLVLAGDMTGYEVVNRLAKKSWPTKILIVSGQIGPAGIPEFGSLDYVQTLAKPFDNAELIRRIGRMLDADAA